MQLKKPTVKFAESIEQTRVMQATIAETLCPACKQKQLKLTKHVAGAKGWETVVACENCNFAGVVNSTGFSFDRVNSKGKAREKT